MDLVTLKSHSRGQVVQSGAAEPTDQNVYVMFTLTFHEMNPAPVSSALSSVSRGTRDML